MSVTKSIWVLCGETSYERDDIICAYEDKIDAEHEKSRLNALLLEKPEAPEMLAADDAWIEYDTKLKTWEEKFPGGTLGSLSCCDGFNVFELHLKHDTHRKNSSNRCNSRA